MTAPPSLNLSALVCCARSAGPCGVVAFRGFGPMPGLLDDRHLTCQRGVKGNRARYMSPHAALTPPPRLSAQERGEEVDDVVRVVTRRGLRRGGAIPPPRGERRGSTGARPRAPRPPRGRGRGGGRRAPA